jgi:hypothetical protein
MVGVPVARWPNTPRTIRDLPEQLPDIFESIAARQPLDLNREHTMKWTKQRKGYQKHGEPPPPEGPVEAWLELRYRFLDEGRIVEITSVTSPTHPI